MSCDHTVYSVCSLRVEFVHELSVRACWWPQGRNDECELRFQQAADSPADWHGRPNCEIVDPHEIKPPEPGVSQLAILNGGRDLACLVPDVDHRAKANRPRRPALERRPTEETSRPDLSALRRPTG
jgi:hypothetical protein